MSSDLPAPPYPADLRAKGFTFAVDWELVKQGKAWILCPPDMRPWLLMLWAWSWTNAPAGSYENDDELIAASIGLDARMFAANRDHLMRGWRLHADGRLYHDHITKMVLEMAGRREKDRTRVADWRAKQKDAVARYCGERSRENDTGTGTGTGTGEKKDKAHKRAGSPAATVSVDVLVDAGVDPQVAADWLTVRRAKRLPLTPTAWDDTRAEADKAGLTTAEAVRTAVRNSWAGFRASWMTNPDTKRLSANELPWHESRSGIVAKGVEMGLGEWDEYLASIGQGERFDQYTARVFSAAGHSPRKAA